MGLLGKKLPPEIVKNIHLLVLDNKWHELFINKKTTRMKSLELKLNDLLKKQGKYNTEHKEYSLLKKKLLDDILQGMTDTNSKDLSMEKNKRYIDEINHKLEKMEKELAEIPHDLNALNAKLLMASMEAFYQRILKRKRILKGMDEKIEKKRKELTEMVGLYTESKEEYEKLYGYMHDLVGPEVIEEYDSYYFKGDKND